jgi:translocation and assembly module TamB
VFKAIAAFIVFPILLGAIIFVFLVKSTAGHNYLLKRIQDQATQSLGVGVHLQNFTLHLTTLSADLYGLTVDGAGPHSYPPLLQVEHGHVGVRVVSVFGRNWYFDTIRIDHPIARVYFDKNGVSNIPTFKSNSSSNTSVFDLGIRHAVLTNGAVYYNDQPRSLALDLRNVEFDSTFESLQKKYSGTLAYSDGRLNYAGTDIPSHSLSVRFDATPGTFHLSPAKIASGNTQVALTASLANYASPVIQAQYNVTLDGQQLSGILHAPSIPSGLVTLTGSAQYQSDQHRPLLQSLVVNGDLSSRQLNASTPSLRAQVSDIAAHYSLASGDATLHDFRANLLGGVVTAHGTMTKIGENDSHTRLDATLHGISLADAKRMMGPSASTGPVAIAGTLNATATAAWGKTVDDLVAHTDATISASVSNHQHQQVAAVPVNLQPSTNSAPPAGPIPVQGSLHATYTAAEKKLAINDSHIHTPQTNLDLNGTVSNQSGLSVKLQASDLREVDAIASLFRIPAPGKPQQLGLAGTANFSGLVSGSTSAPHLTGQLAAQNLQFQGSTWKEVHTGIDASPSQVSLQHAELTPATQGRISLNASAQLRKWSFSNDSPVQVKLSATQIDVAELAKLTSSQVPVTGTLAASISMHGSVLRPEGNGNITLTKAAAYGEPITSAKVTFTGGGDQAHANLAIVSHAGSINGVVAASPNEKTFSAELTSTGIHLDQLQYLKDNGTNLSGVVAISAKGHGTFDNPEADATIQIPKLLVQDQTISDIRLQANLANHIANAQLSSTALNAAIKANARVTLTGDFPADATLDTQGIPLGPLLATYAPDQAANISGQTEVHATLHGPLKKMREVEAHVTIPLLKVDYSNTVQLAATAPIHADYKDGIINVQHSSIRGTDTDLQFQGTIPTTGNAPMSLLLLGSIDMHLAQLFDPDLRTSGQLKFNVNSYGGANGPDVAGTIDVVDASMSSPDMPVGLQHCNGTLSVTKDRINISQLKGNVGGGTITAQGGVALRPSVQFNMGIAARDVRMLYPQGMRESIDATLRFTGTPKAALLGGNVNLTDLSFTRAFDLNNFMNQFAGGVEAPPSQGFTQDIALNVAVHSTNSVNLVSRTLSVGGSANLQVRGTASDPVILGRVNLTGGDMIFNGNRFVLTGGTIQFVNPSVTEPAVNLTITTSIQQYNISLRFDGPVDQMRTQYTSDPALPSADIIHLLAFGSTTEAAANNATPANQAAESLVANQVSSQVTSRLSKVAGISQLSINPVLGGSGQQNAGANITIQQRVTGNLFVTFSTNTSTTQGQTVQGQYQVSPRVAVSATRDPNGGFAVDTLIKKTW